MSNLGCWCPLCGLSLHGESGNGDLAYAGTIAVLEKHLGKAHLSDKRRAYLVAKAVELGMEWDTARRHDATLET